MAGRRFGKTLLLISRILKAAEKPNSRIWYVAPYKNQAKEIAWFEFLRIIPKEFIKKVNEIELYIRLKNGSQISLKGADRDNLRGPGLDFIGVDEAQDLKADSWYAVLSPMLIGRDGKAILIGTKLEKNWFREFWLKVDSGVVRDHKCFYFPSWANTFINADEWAREKETKSLLVWEQEFVSDPRVESNAIEINRKFPEFDRRVHVVSPFEIPKTWKRYRGMDWGVSHPTVCLWASVSPDGRIYIYDEISVRGKSVDSLSQIILEKTGDNKIETSVLDVACWHTESDGTSIADKFIKSGIQVIRAKREDRAKSGAYILKSFFKTVKGESKIFIFSGLNILADQLEKITWEDTINDDSVDALVYLVTYLSMIQLGTGKPDNGIQNGTVDDGDFLLDYKDGNIVRVRHKLISRRETYAEFDEYGNPK